MEFDYNNIPEGTRRVRAVNYKKIVGEAKDVDLNKPDLFEKMQELGWKMVNTCVHDSGIGLAAPQLGIPKKVFIMIDFEKPHLWSFKGTYSLIINPVISPVRGSERYSFPEGCLSVPGKQLTIARPREIDVTYWYFDKKGKLQQNAKERIGGYPARIFQHEYDHLFGMDIVQLYDRQNAKPRRGRPPGSKNSKKTKRRK